MKLEDTPEAQLAWTLWNLQARLNDLLWQRYEREFLNFVMQQEQESHPPDDPLAEIEF